jgi:hypothetical protein
MSTFAYNMIGVASSLINEFGNDVVLKKVITTGKVYNPITDEYEGTDDSIIVNTKCVYSKLKEGDKTLEDIGKVSNIATVPYSDDIADIDNTWTIDDNKILSVKSTKTQSKDIVFKLYVG